MSKDINHTGKLGFPLASDCLEFFNSDNFSMEVMFSESGEIQMSVNCQYGGGDGFDVSKYDRNPADFNVLKDTRYAATVIVIYTLVILVGGVGNALVVVTVARSRHMWNATNIFIANLALADVFVCVFDLPLSLYYQLTEQWIFGSALCHVIPPLFAVVVYASTLTLAMIAVDRFVLIVYPLQTRMSVQMALVFVVVIAVISAAVASPIAIYASLVEVEIVEVQYHKIYCTEAWPTIQRRQLYTVLTVVFQFFLPLVLIGILYFLIFRSVRGRMRGRGSRRNRTTKMLLAVVLAFAITWTPFHLYALLSEFRIISGRFLNFVDVVMRAFAMSSSCLNPFLYAWMNDNFRIAFVATLKRPRKDGMHCLQRCQNSDRITTKTCTQMPLNSMRSQAMQDRSYMDEASNANDVMLNNYNYNQKPVETGSLLTVPETYRQPMNGIIKDDVTAVRKPLLKKHNNV